MEAEVPNPVSPGRAPDTAPSASVPPPERYESDVVLKNGSTLHLRPARPEDAAGLLEFFRALSPESPYLRFLGVPPFDLARAESLARSDSESQFGLVGETRQGIVALGHFHRDPENPERAEVAFAVADALQGQGIGTSLLDRLARVAREVGIRTFVADVLSYNRKMIEVFVDSGFGVRQRAEDGVVGFEISLASTAASAEKAAERARYAATASMQAFFEPRSVAVVGAGRERGRIGAEILHNLRACGFRGAIYPVNQRDATIQAPRCYPRATAIKAQDDLPETVVPAAQVEAVVD